MAGAPGPHHSPQALILPTPPWNPGPCAALTAGSHLLPADPDVHKTAAPGDASGCGTERTQRHQNTCPGLRGTQAGDGDSVQVASHHPGTIRIPLHPAQDGVAPSICPTGQTDIMPGQTLLVRGAR